MDNFYPQPIALWSHGGRFRKRTSRVFLHRAGEFIANPKLPLITRGAGVRTVWAVGRDLSWNDSCAPICCVMVGKFLNLAFPTSETAAVTPLRAMVLSP